MSSRRCFVGGNWKCTGIVASVKELVVGLNKEKVPQHVDVVVSPSPMHVPMVMASLDSSYTISAQNCSRTGPGAFTGEVSAAQLKDFNINWTILGHSERRAYYGDTDEIVGEKVSIAIKEGLSVIACVGETLEDRKANKTMDVVIRQMKPIVAAVKGNWSQVVIAYEPVWAIGTGVVATPEQAQEVHASLRQWISKNVNDGVANAVRIIYGGSVKPHNSADLIGRKDIDGFLVGGASLKAADFSAIFNSIPPSKSKI